METKLEINTRLGLRQISRENIIHFPKGLAGLDGLHEYTLLQIRPEVPMLILQSIQTEAIGLVVVDPRIYIADYKCMVDPAELALLHLEDDDNLLILVTVSIPHGKPEQTALNLTGPILINTKEKIGLQIMQVDSESAKQFRLNQLMDNTCEESQAQPEPIKKKKESTKKNPKAAVGENTKASTKNNTNKLDETSVK